MVLFAPGGGTRLTHEDDDDDGMEDYNECWVDNDEHNGDVDVDVHVGVGWRQNLLRHGDQLDDEVES